VGYANALSAYEGLPLCYSLPLSECSGSWQAGTLDCGRVVNPGVSAPTVQQCAGYRLLTESEWERAARGGTTTAYFWGNSSDASLVGPYAWFGLNSGGRTQEVGTKTGNAYGLFDMSGNVWEWVWDWVIGFTEGSLVPSWHYYPLVSATDWSGPASGTNRGVRGGSMRFSAPDLRLAHRYRSEPAFREDDLGFRLARTAP
jgi:formylglycine-generating enzyme required for sulfatase activity